MSDKERVRKVAAKLGVGAIPPNWTGVDAVLPLLEKMKSEGAIVVLKWDGERLGPSAAPYTVIVSGKPVEPDFLRKDTESLEDALSYAISEYAKRRWKI